MEIVVKKYENYDVSIGDKTVQLIFIDNQYNSCVTEEDVALTRDNFRFFSEINRVIEGIESSYRQIEIEKEKQEQLIEANKHLQQEIRSFNLIRQDLNKAVKELEECTIILDSLNIPKDDSVSARFRYFLERTKNTNIKK